MAVNNFASVTTVNLVRSDGDFDITVGAGIANFSIQDIALEVTLQTTVLGLFIMLKIRRQVLKLTA